MSTVVEALAVVLLLAAVMFFVAGTIGLLRFPDTLSRLHALTKVDNVALGLLIGALALSATDAAVALELLLIWIIVMFSGATTSHLIAKRIEREADDRDA